MASNLTTAVLVLTCLAGSPASDAQQGDASPATSTPLLGKGLKQHPFLYCGEWRNQTNVRMGTAVSRPAVIASSHRMTTFVSAEDLHIAAVPMAGEYNSIPCFHFVEDRNSGSRPSTSEVCVGNAYQTVGQGFSFGETPLPPFSPTGTGTI